MAQQDQNNKTQKQGQNSSKDLKKHWNRVKTQLKSKFSDLKDEDLRFDEGNEEELYNRIESRTGKSKEEIKREIDRIMQEETAEV